jgi:type II secretory pathway pseudopilin PulG
MNIDEDQQPTVEQVSMPKVETETAVNTPGVIILQWLSYAFWGWLILALIWLMGVIFTHAILGSSSNETVPYAIAAGIVLLPIAFLTDFFYRKHEPVKKTGIAMVIMVIHAVLFALLAIASLIVTVFTGLNSFIDTSSNIDAKLVTIFTALGATLFYALTLIRVLNPFKSKKPVFVYSLVLVAATILLLILAIVGPFLQTIATKNDRRIEQNLSSVNQEISSYTQTNAKLPTSLSQVNFKDEGARLLVKDGLVSYQTETSAVNVYSSPNSVEYRYQLCVTYKDKDSSMNTSNSSYQNDYPSYLIVAGHGKGQVCYKLSATSYQAASSSQGIQLEKAVLN